mgnify:CR=1 FL=1
MAYIRDDGEQRLLVAINAGEQDHCIYLPRSGTTQKR